MRAYDAKAVRHTCPHTTYIGASPRTRSISPRTTIHISSYYDTRVLILGNAGFFAKKRMMQALTHAHACSRMLTYADAGNAGFFAKKRMMQKLCPALLTKQTGLPPKEQLAIIENPACIPLPELSAEAVASIDKAVALAEVCAIQ